MEPWDGFQAIEMEYDTGERGGIEMRIGIENGPRLSMGQVVSKVEDDTEVVVDVDRTEIERMVRDAVRAAVRESVRPAVAHAVRQAMLRRHEW